MVDLEKLRNEFLAIRVKSIDFFRAFFSETIDEELCKDINEMMSSVVFVKDIGSPWMYNIHVGDEYIGCVSRFIEKGKVVYQICSRYYHNYPKHYGCDIPCVMIEVARLFKDFKSKEEKEND